MLQNSNFWLSVFTLSLAGGAWALGAKKDYWGWFALPMFIASAALSALDI
jgi:hypothetical protein